LHQELLAARCQIESQANQILSLEAALLARPPLPSDTPESEKDRIVVEQAKTIQELEIVIGKYEENLGDLPRSAEDAEKQWIDKVASERSKREEAEVWAQEVVRAMEKERKVTTALVFPFSQAEVYASIRRGGN
jgi:centromeric protein E